MHARVTWNEEKGIAQIWKHDASGWFKAGWGFTIDGVVRRLIAQGFQVSIYKRAV
jgi:hypothetical protein